MIARLSGTVLEKHVNRVVVDVAGVGYDVLVPLSTFYGLGEAGASITLRVHTHVREDQIALFGFATRLEQQLFERLISVSGIGPKVALSVLSGIEPAEFVRAVMHADAARLTSIPGIGRKTAERITLELRDRLPAIEPSLAAAASGPSTPASGLRDDVMSALVNLGYQRPAVEKAVDAAAKAAGGAEPPAFEDWLRQSLRHLSR